MSFLKETKLFCKELNLIFKSKFKGENQFPEIGNNETMGPPCFFSINMLERIKKTC